MLRRGVRRPISRPVCRRIGRNCCCSERQDCAGNAVIDHVKLMVYSRSFEWKMIILWRDAAKLCKEGWRWRFCETLERIKIRKGTVRALPTSESSGEVRYLTNFSSLKKISGLFLKRDLARPSPFHIFLLMLVSRLFAVIAMVLLLILHVKVHGHDVHHYFMFHSQRHKQQCRRKPHKGHQWLI